MYWMWCSAANDLRSQSWWNGSILSSEHQMFMYVCMYIKRKSVTKVSVRERAADQFCTMDTRSLAMDSTNSSSSAWKLLT